MPLSSAMKAKIGERKSSQVKRVSIPKGVKKGPAKPNLGGKR